MATTGTGTVVVSRTADPVVTDGRRVGGCPGVIVLGSERRVLVRRDLFQLARYRESGQCDRRPGEPGEQERCKNASKESGHQKSIRQRSLPNNNHTIAGFPADIRLGGEGGIRTHGTGISRTHAFQACALSRSATSPKRARENKPALRPCQKARSPLAAGFASTSDGRPNQPAGLRSG